VASAGPYASLHLAPDRQPRQYPTTLFVTGRMPFLPTNQQCQSTEGGPKWPELCIKTVIRLCTGISQNHHPCLLSSPFRTGHYLLFRNLFLILWYRSHSDVIIDVIACSECSPGGPKIIVTPLGVVKRNLFCNNQPVVVIINISLQYFTAGI